MPKAQTINKDKKKEYNSKHYSKIKEKLLEKVECPVCFSSVARAAMRLHKQSKKHQLYERLKEDGRIQINE